MDLGDKNAGTVTPVKDGYRAKIQETSRINENKNPNFFGSSPGQKSNKSPATKSAKSQKSAAKGASLVVYSPRNRIRERKFIVARKNSKKDNLGGSKIECKCKEKFGGNLKKCLCVAYEKLRASQEEFFNIGENKNGNVSESDRLNGNGAVEDNLDEEIENKLMIQDLQIQDGYEEKVELKNDLMAANEYEAANEYDDRKTSGNDSPIQMGSATIKRRRERVLEEARNSLPESGSGTVMHLVRAFEKFLKLPNSKDSDEKDEKKDNDKAMKWALPGLQPPKAREIQASSSSFCPSELFLTSENLGLDNRSSVSSPWDSSRGSVSSRTSNAGQRRRRNSLDSTGTMGGSKWKKKQQLKNTSQQPFKLRTEQRGKTKEEEFTKKIQEMMREEERLRIPLAQGVPFTTDEPECLIKPAVKENTRPIDLVLHSDVRAMERAEFDQEVAEKMSMIEQFKMERERLQKMEEEEDVRRLRKELVPKAQPMPYFDRPFIPRRSMRQPTIPKDPKFQVPQKKKIKCLLSWNDMNSSSYTSQF